MYIYVYWRVLNLKFSGGLSLEDNNGPENSFPKNIAFRDYDLAFFIVTDR